jgi:acetyltransferase
LETEETDPVAARKLCYGLRQSKASIPTFRYPDRGTSVHYMWRYSYNLRSLYETLQRTDDVAEEMHSTARTEEVLRPVREQNRRLLTESSHDTLLLVGCQITLQRG